MKRVIRVRKLSSRVSKRQRGRSCTGFETILDLVGELEREKELRWSEEDSTRKEEVECRELILEIAKNIGAHVYRREGKPMDLEEDERQKAQDKLECEDEKESRELLQAMAAEFGFSLYHRSGKTFESFGHPIPLKRIDLTCTFQALRDRFRADRLALLESQVVKDDSYRRVQLRTIDGQDKSTWPKAAAVVFGCPCGDCTDPRTVLWVSGYAIEKTSFAQHHGSRWYAVEEAFAKEIAEQKAELELGADG